MGLSKAFAFPFAFDSFALAFSNAFAFPKAFASNIFKTKPHGFIVVELAEGLVLPSIGLHLLALLPLFPPSNSDITRPLLIVFVLPDIGGMSVRSVHNPATIAVALKFFPNLSSICFSLSHLLLFLKSSVAEMLLLTCVYFCLQFPSTILLL